MATRFYLPHTGGPAAPVSPTPDAAWNKTSQMDRFKCTLSANGTAIGPPNRAANGATIPSNVACRQYVSDGISTSGAALLAATPGNVKGQLRALEGVSTDDVTAQIVIRLLDSAGTTVRGTLLAADAPADIATAGHEWPAGTSTNRQFPRAGSTALTAVASAVAGDRIVIEVGYRHFASTTNNMLIRFGDNAGSDLPEDETTQTDLNPWIEFSANLIDPAANLVALGCLGVGAR